MLSGVTSTVSSGIRWGALQVAAHPATVVALLAMSYLPKAEALSGEAFKVCMKECLGKVEQIGFWGPAGCAIVCGTIAVFVPGK